MAWKTCRIHTIGLATNAEPAVVDQLAQAVVGQQFRPLGAGEDLEPVRERLARGKLPDEAPHAERRVGQAFESLLDRADAKRLRLGKPDVGRVVLLRNQHGGEVLGVDADVGQRLVLPGGLQIVLGDGRTADFAGRASVEQHDHVAQTGRPARPTLLAYHQPSIGRPVGPSNW